MLLINSRIIQIWIATFIISAIFFDGNPLITKTFYVADENILALSQAIQESEKTPEKDTISLAKFGHYTFISEVHEHHEVSLLPVIHSEIYLEGNKI